MGGEPFSKLQQALLSFAEAVASANKGLQEQIERLQGRALALELFVKALVSEGNTGCI